MEKSPILKGKRQNTHRVSCHHCGNLRKKTRICTICPYVYCYRCSIKMFDMHGPDVFDEGCPVCKHLCCCYEKNPNCVKKYHCYKKCYIYKKNGSSPISISQSKFSQNSEHYLTPESYNEKDTIKFPDFDQLVGPNSFIVSESREYFLDDKVRTPTSLFTSPVYRGQEATSFLPSIEDEKVKRLKVCSSSQSTSDTVDETQTSCQNSKIIEEKDYYSSIPNYNLNGVLEEAFPMIVIMPDEDHLSELGDLVDEIANEEENSWLGVIKTEEL